MYEFIIISVIFFMFIYACIWCYISIAGFLKDDLATQEVRYLLSLSGEVNNYNFRAAKSSFS